MPEYRHILLEKDASEHIAKLTLNRPDRLNAMNDIMLGFLTKLVPQEDLESTAMEMARKIAAGPPVAIRLSKLMLYKGLAFDLETAMKMAAAAETITLTSRDHEEGTTAFRESRKPVYEGR